MIDFKNSPMLKWGLTSLGGGMGGALGLAAIKELGIHPEFVPQLLNGGFLFFALCVVGLVIASKKADAFTAMHERSVVANEQLASNVGALVNRDDARERRMDLLIGELTRTSENNAGSLKRIEEWIDGQRTTAH